MTMNGIDTSGRFAGPDPLRHSNQTDGIESSDRQPADRSSAAQDRIEISNTARELARLSRAEGADGVAGSFLNAEHLRTILARFGDGFYDSPEVQLEIASRIISAPEDSSHPGLTQT